jgi:hypothetical protein
VGSQGINLKELHPETIMETMIILRPNLNPKKGFLVPQSTVFEYTLSSTSSCWSCRVEYKETIKQDFDFNDDDGL